MVKPGFTDSVLIKDVIDTLKSKGVDMLDFAYINYDENVAKLHYIEKSGKPYFQELVDYLTSDKSFGMIFIGDNALSICRSTVEELRQTLPKKYNLKTDVMRNVLHCSSKTKVGEEMLALWLVDAIKEFINGGNEIKIIYLNYGNDLLEKRIIEKNINANELLSTSFELELYTVYNID